jgi:hypothetical protein
MITSIPQPLIEMDLMNCPLLPPSACHKSLSSRSSPHKQLPGTIYLSHAPGLGCSLINKFYFSLDTKSFSWTGGMAPVIECLLSMYEDLISTSSAIRKVKKELNYFQLLPIAYFSHRNHFGIYVLLPTNSSSQLLTALLLNLLLLNFNKLLK